MVNDFQGDAKDFAVVIPVPTFLEKDQIHVGNQATVDHLDAYSAPRLVEYWDPDPVATDADESHGCRAEWRDGHMAHGEDRDRCPGREDRGAVHGRRVRHRAALRRAERRAGNVADRERLQDSRRGERRAGRLHQAEDALLRGQGEPGGESQGGLQLPASDPGGLRKPQVHAAHPPGHGQCQRAAGTFRLCVDARRAGWRPPTTAPWNYPPAWTCRSTSRTSSPTSTAPCSPSRSRQQDGKAVFKEYAWDMGWCDPCAAEPLSADELRSLGVFWQEDTGRPPAGGVSSGPCRRWAAARRTCS